MQSTAGMLLFCYYYLLLSEIKNWLTKPHAVLQKFLDHLTNAIKGFGVEIPQVPATCPNDKLTSPGMSD